MENQDLLEALDFLDPGTLTYEEWTIVGMGLKQAGYPVTSWEQWSARDGGRYHRGECARKWALPRQPQPRYREQHLQAGPRPWLGRACGPPPGLERCHRRPGRAQ